MRRRNGIVVRGLAVFTIVGMLPFLVHSRAQSAPATSVEQLDLEDSRVRKRADGLFEFTTRNGNVITSHGYDPKPGFSGEWVTNDSVRQPICATDYYFHVLYVYRTGTTDRYTSALGQMLQNVKNSNWVVNQEAIESGGHTADLKVLCDQYGEVRIDKLTSPSADFYDIVDAAEAAGFNKSNVKYWIYYHGTANVCGMGNFDPDDRLSPTNFNNLGPTYAVSYDSCWDGRTALHEASHNMGAVQANAPYSTGTGAHCNEDIDVMCYVPDGGNRNQSGMISRCMDHVHYDCGHDTYFDTEPESGEWLETHWNLGDVYNRFIAFDGIPSPPPANRPPIASFTWRCPSATCYFDDSSVDIDGTIASWSWNFGDGGTSTVRDATHTYASSGVFNATVTLTDNQGATTNFSKQIAVYTSDPDPSTPTIGYQQSRWEYAGANGSWKYFKVLLTEDTPRLTVTLDGPACTRTDVPCDRFLQTLPVYGYPGGANLDLYLRKEARPTSSSWICRPNEADSDETCYVTNPAGGIYYIGVYVYWRYSQQVPDGYSIKMTY